MITTKYFYLLMVLYLTHQSSALPTVDISQARSIGSTVWDWISYPFTWWSSSPENVPVNDQLVGVTRGPFDNIEIGKRNITVWCNDHTCTTMKCSNKGGCANVTCNIYDTDLNGECREYNTEKTLVEVTPAPVQTTATQDKPVQNVVNTPATIATVIAVNQDGTVKEEKPLELEAAMSSTVLNGNV